MSLIKQRENEIIVPGAKKAGFGLIELMVAVALGLLITAAVTAMAVNSLKMSSDTLKSARLNQDMGAVMQIMVNDIRRAGYVSCVSDPTASPPVDCKSDLIWKDVIYDDQEGINIASSSCILYSYNRSSDDVKDADERLGFKLENNQLSMRISCGDDDNYDQAATNCATDCTQGTWVSMIDSGIINVTRFALDTEGSKCHNIDEAVSIQIEPGSSATEFACNESNKANVQEWGVDDDGNPGWVDFSESTSLPFDTAQSVGVRNVNISLEAELTGDSSVSKNLNVSIRVRNDHVY